jgi:D-alanine-D-alanine ligase
MKDVATLISGGSAEPPDSLASGRGRADTLGAIRDVGAPKPKPVGSSFGVGIVRENHRHPPREVGRGDWPFVDAQIAERFSAEEELSSAAMGDPSLVVIELQALSEAFYRKVGSRHVLPADLKPNIYHKVQESTLMAPRALRGGGVSRADLRYDETKGKRASSCVSTSTRSPT